MASGGRLTTDSYHLLDMQNQLRMPSYADNMNTTQPFSFTSTTNTTHLWSHVDFVPEKIVDLSVTMDGLRFYKVQWRESWVTEHQLLSHANVLQDFWSKQNEPNLPSSTKNSSTPQVTTACKTNTTSQKNGEEMSNLNAEPGTDNAAAQNSASVIVRSEGRQTPSTSISDVSAANSNNDLSGNKPTEQEVNPTLASLGKNVVPDKYEDNVDLRGNGENLPSKQKISNQGISSTSKIDKVMFCQQKNKKDNGKSVECNGIEILCVKNTFATETEIQEKACELASSFKRKRRKFENGGSYNDPDTCFFCLKEVSNGKRLRQHIFNVHLKNFGQHTCEVCHSKFFYSRELKAHMKTHSEERGIICKVCKVTFKGRSALYKHMKTHEKESNFRCDVCHKNFKVQADLKTHCLEEHKNQITNCNVCKQKLLTGNSVYLHSMRHSGTRDFVCDQCSQRFKLKQHLMEHQVTHSSEKLACPFCEKKIKTQRSLFDHMRIFHREDTEQYKGKYTCPVCKKEYKEKGRLYTHIRHVHGEETQKENSDMEKTMELLQKKMKTTVYMKRSKVQKALKAIDMSDEELSELSHKIDKITNPDTGDVRLRCKMCKQSYVMVSVMLKHLQDHKNGKVKKVYVCKDCGIKFRNNFLLQQHRKIHIVPKKRSQQSQTPPSLKLQVRAMEDIHENVEKITYTNGKLKFRCKICPKREFLLVRAMKKHLLEHENNPTSNTHIMEDGNLCDKCEKSFKTKKRLQLHQKISHQMSSTVRDKREDPNGQNILKMNRKRKQHIPMKLDTTGKRSAALNANSLVRLQMEEVLSGDDVDGGADKCIGEGIDYEPCGDFGD